LEIMMRDILVHAGEGPADLAPAVRYACALAAVTGARLTGICAIPPVTAVFGGAEVLMEVLACARRKNEQALARAAQFRQVADEYGVHCSEWQVATGELIDVIAQVGNWHDLAVLRAELPAGSNLGALLLAAGIPCVILPQQWTKMQMPRCAALAWNGSPESIRAIHAALPLLTLVRRLVVLRGRRCRAEFAPELQPPFDIDAYLSRVGLHTETIMIDAADEDAGSALLAAATETGVDLLVTGAWGHWRIGEWIFGGATRHLLKHSALPLLMKH
jgi:nucleotide-binding universal stress UspA family protein